MSGPNIISAVTFNPFREAPSFRLPPVTLLPPSRLLAAAMLERSMYWDEDYEVEDIERYTVGGYHPVRLGDVLSSSNVHTPSRHYRILHKLGQGSFATVWLADVLYQPS